MASTKRLRNLACGFSNGKIKIKNSVTSQELEISIGTRTSGSERWQGNFQTGNEWNGSHELIISLNGTMTGVETDVGPPCKAVDGESPGAFTTIPFECPANCSPGGSPSASGPGSTGGTSSGDWVTFGPLPLTGNAGNHFYDMNRENGATVGDPFGSSSPTVGHSLFRYIKASSGDPRIIKYFEGGSYRGFVKLANGCGDVYVNDDGSVIATVVMEGPNTFLDWMFGRQRQRFPAPNGTNPQFIKEIRNLDTNEYWTYTYSGSPTWKILYLTNQISQQVILNWNGNNTLNRIDYPNGSKQEFFYNENGSTGLTGIKNWFQTTLLGWTRWAEDANNRILRIEKRDLSTGNVVATNTFTPLTYPDNRLQAYQKFGNTYSVSYTTPGFDKVITAPDTSRVEYLSSRTGTRTTRTSTVRDNSSPGHNQISKTVVEESPGYGLVHSVQDGANHTTTYHYVLDDNPQAPPDQAGLLIDLTYPDENYIHNTYSDKLVTRSSQMTSSDVELAYIQYEYDEENRITRTHTGGLNDSIRDYEGDDLHSITDGEGRETIFGYNEHRQLESVGNGTYSITFDYDSLGRRELTTSPLGIETKYEYHTSTGNLSKVYNDYKGGAQLVYKTEYKYDQNGYGNNLAEVLDAEGRKTTYEYDVWDRLQYEKVWDGVNLAGTIEYEYDSGMGEYLQKKTDMFGHETIYDYYAPGFLKYQSWNRYDPQTQAIRNWGSVGYTYDGAGRVETVASTKGDCDSCNSTKTYVYNTNNQVTSHTANQAGTISYGYDGVGRLNSVDIPNEGGTAGLNTVGYTYDVANRLDTVASGIISTFDMSYNLADQVELIDFVYTDIVYDYDTQNAHLKQIWVNYPSGMDRTIDYGYNADGLRTSAKLDNNRTIAYLYDNLNRLVQESGHKETVGNCITLNGSGDYLEPVSGGDLGGSMTQLTIEAKVYLNQLPASTAVIFKRGGGSYPYSYAKLFINNSGYLVFEMETDSSDDSVMYFDALPIKEWVHVAATWSSGVSMKLYVNGSLRATGASLGGTLQGTGTDRPRMGEGLNGKMDEIHIRNLAVSSFSGNLYTDYTVSGNTLGLWHLNETSGTIAYDADSGDPQNADLRGNAAWSNGTNDYGIPHYLHQYTYDKVGNRKKMVKSWAKGTPGFERWSMDYNGLNQLVKRYSGTSWAGTNNDYRFEYQYDANGNLTLKKQEKKTSGVWNQEDKLECRWNPRNQLTRAVSYGSGANNVGSVDYQYCLSCDGALSERMQYAGGIGAASGTLTSHRRYEYDGLNLLRIDELCDADGDGVVEAGETTWRKVEVNTHKPGALGALLAKRVYSYPTTGNRCVSNGNTNYAYTYDAVGNVFCVLNSSGGEVYRFSQDAFGNSISISDFTGSDWTTARTVGITEHQTGKWIDPLTGMYYFAARWYDPVVGRFVGRDEGNFIGSDLYCVSFNCPMSYIDVDGRCADCIGFLDNSSSPIVCTPPQFPIGTPFPTPISTPPPPAPPNTPRCQNSGKDDRKHYGNYCGEGGDEWKSKESIFHYLILCPPIDDQDMCCLRHDFCYLKWKDTFHYKCENKTETEKECDCIFCKCVMNLDEWPENLYGIGVNHLFCGCGCDN